MRIKLERNCTISFRKQDIIYNIQGFMARPIKETPVVTGKDAKRFAEKIAHLKPESKEEREAAKKVYAKFKAQYTFW